MEWANEGASDRPRMRIDQDVDVVVVHTFDAFLEATPPDFELPVESIFKGEGPPIVIREESGTW